MVLGMVVVVWGWGKGSHEVCTLLSFICRRTIAVHIIFHISICFGPDLCFTNEMNDLLHAHFNIHH